MNSVLSGVVNLVSGLLGGIGNALQSTSSSIELNLVLIPKVDNMANIVQQRAVQVLSVLDRNDYKIGFFTFTRDVLREQTFLRSGTAPSTAAAIQNEKKAVDDLTQRFNQLNDGYIQLYVAPNNCSHAPACSNTSIQVANCSCYTSNEVAIFLYDYLVTFVGLKLKDLAFFKAAITKDYNDQIENPATVQDFVRVGTDTINTYEYIYQNNGQVDDAQVSADVTEISRAINILNSTYPESISTAAYVGEY